MTERASDRSGDSDRVEHFLTDGVAPPVIGDGAEPEDKAAWHEEPDYEPEYREPPTAPIPTAPRLANTRKPEKRKPWLARIFRLRD
jgi:hypothetical protein